MLIKMLKIILIFIATISSLYANTCKNYELFATKFAQQSDELEASADNTSLTNKNVYKLSGNAEVYSNKYYLSADNIEIIKSSKTINATNNVKIRTGDIYATTDKVALNATTNTAHIVANNIKYIYTNTNANGSADEFITQNNTQNLKNATYSFCQSDDKEWQIKAESIILDKDKNLGIAEDVKLEIFGLPVFYTPQYKWILKGRETGFLFPSFSSYTQNNKTGYQIDIPYYFNLAPEKDLTLTFKNLSTRGQAINGLYRHLLASNKTDGYIESEIEYIGHDKITNDSRWFADIQFNKKINNYTQLELDINRVSDANYLKDISHNNTDEALQSSAKLSYAKEGLVAHIFTEKEQLINNGTANYTVDLELFAKQDFEKNGINFSLSGQHTSFDYKGEGVVVGNRSHINFDAYTHYLTNEYSFQPHINLNATNYNLENTDNHSREMYSIGLDYKYFLERETNIFGKNILQTLTPRISYLYAPEKNQNHLPNFDSSENNITYDDLFLGNTWSGVDRIDGFNNIAIGMESSFIDNDDGTIYANLNIARSYNINTGKNSITIASADFNYGDWKLYNLWQYDNNIIEKHNKLSYNKNGIDFFSLSHHKDNNGQKHASMYIAKPIVGKSHIFAGVTRNISEKTNNKQSIGFVYDDCCTAFRIAHFREYSTSNIYDKFIKFEMIFKGLGTTDKNLYNKIKDTIPNYLPEI